MISESHCHLRTLNDDAIEQAIKRAKKARIKLALVAGVDIKSSKQEILNAKKYGILKACVGIHPWNADEYGEEALWKLKKLAADKEVVAISEIGLDFVGRRNREGEFVNEYFDKELQRKAFRGQLRMAKELGLPVIVHDRTPGQEIIDIIKEEKNAEIGAAIHGFSKTLAYSKRCVDLGIYLSIGLRGVTAQENLALTEAIRHTPLEWLITETDSRNPEEVLTVVKKIAELKELPISEVGLTTTDNLRKITKL